jgi:Leucine-rich repeat (LRR) protein
MRKLVPLIFRVLIPGLICTGCRDVPEPEPDGTIHFADDSFLEALITQGVDLNGDGYIVESEAEQVDSLFVGNYGISDLKGIEAFANLEILVCWINQLISLDLSENGSLKKLWCGDNRIPALDLTGNPALEIVACDKNELTSLDLSECSLLETLSCGDNHLTYLDISACL